MVRSSQLLVRYVKGIEELDTAQAYALIRTWETGFRDMQMADKDDQLDQDY
jgi:hypothetical protein